MVTRKKAEPEPEPGAWRLTWGTRTWTENDLTTGDLLELALLLGNDFRQMMPESPLQRAAFLMVLEARASGDSFEVVRDRIRAASAIEFLGALTLDG